jgi:hypothetical protein
MATKSADKFKCPRCGSGRTKPLSVAIAGGTRRRNTIGVSRRSMWGSTSTYKSDLVSSLPHPPGVKPERFHLIAPYETDSRQWLKRRWIDQYSEKLFRITTTGPHGDRQTARVKTYGDVLVEHEYHPESKCADVNGNTCGKQTIGLLQRRHVQIDQIKYIGKESNSLEDVEYGLIHSEQSVYTEYPDPRRDEWQTKIVPALREIKLPILEKESGLSRRMLIKARNGHVRPHRKNQERLASIVRKLGYV